MLSKKKKRSKKGIQNGIRNNDCQLQLPKCLYRNNKSNHNSQRALPLPGRAIMTVILTSYFPSFANEKMEVRSLRDLSKSLEPAGARTRIQHPDS